ncbi:MAG: SCO family protein, partial [Cytophagales bacterium]
FIGLVLIGFVYFMTSKNKEKAASLPYFGIDSITSNNDTIWHSVGDFRLTNQLGESVSQSNLENTIYVADFFFVNCPGICVKMAKQMGRVFEAYKDNPNIKIVSHTVNPENDSVAVLLDYAKRRGVADHSKWLFLTGEKAAIYKLAREQYYATATQGDGGVDDFVHTERFTLVDKNKKIRGFYDGTNENEVNQMMFDIERLLKE